MAIKKDIDETTLIKKPSPTLEAVVGQIFTRLKVVEYLGYTACGRSSKDYRVRAVCECGSLHIYRVSTLRAGLTKSCGCLQAELTSIRARTHGQKLNSTPTRAYRAWRAMIDRCCYPSSVAWKRYGGAGITVDPRWRGSFEAFIADMGDPPTDKHTLDRFPNQKGNYEKTNCRWATQKEQCNNFSRNHIILVDGESLTLSQAGDKFGIRGQLISSRLRYGWSEEDAAKSPPRINSRNRHLYK